MDEREKKAFDFAADLTKQLITLSTGIVTITLLFSKDFVGSRLLAVGAWIFYLLSTIFGLWALTALTGTLAPIKPRKAKAIGGARAASSNRSENETGERLEIGSNVRKPSGLQIVAFLVATVLTLAYVVATFASPPKAAPSSPTTCCCQCQPVSSAH